MTNLKYIFCVSIAVLLIGCAATHKAELAAGDNAYEAVNEITALNQTARDMHADLLSAEEFDQAMKYLEKARRTHDANGNGQAVLDNAGIAKAYFQQAIANAESRKANAARIIRARQDALDAGLARSDRLLDKLAGIDERLDDATDSFSRSLNPEQFSEFQKRYYALEIEAVRFTELDAVRRAIQNAVDDGANKLAPDSLGQAMFDLKEAENLIAQSPRDPSVYHPLVETSIESAILLADVMEVISNSKGTPENVAVQVVRQNRELNRLSRNVDSLEQNLGSAKSVIEQKVSELQQQRQELYSTKKHLQQTEGLLQQRQQELESTKLNLVETTGALLMQNQALEQTSTKVRFQRAMDEAVKKFPDDVVSAYQQENKLIFRLKQINFPSGKSQLPDESTPLLTDINEIIKGIGARLVAVEGHTDSIGTTEFNQKLSTDRAISVANYMAALDGGYQLGYVGYGESRPIASNETESGRAINRRVDLVITARKSIEESQ